MFERVHRCRCCRGADLSPVLDLGQQPLANSYVQHPTDLPVFPLELQVCRDCFHNQLSVVVEPDLMFRHYLYVSGTSRTFRAHFAQFARETVEWVQPRAQRVLDLACNDGTLLEAFEAEGCAVTGVDPALNLVELARGKGLDVIAGYWPEAQARLSGRFDLITAANVLAHVADPEGFLAAALDRLSDHGAVVVEFPYCRDMLLKCEWDTIYHEHLSYFLVGPLLRLFDRLEAAAIQVRRVPNHGGSLRIALHRGRGAHCPEILALAEAERSDGLTDLATYAAFARRVDGVCGELEGLIAGKVQQGKRVIGYGASAKGNTLLNRCRLPLSYIVDDNPLKVGHLTPGRQIPIRAPTAVKEDGPELHVLLLAWNFAREIVQNLRSWRPNQRDQVIHYVPKVRCHALDVDLPLLE